MLGKRHNNREIVRDFGLVSSRISKLLIHVAEAEGAPPALMRNPTGLFSKPDELLAAAGTILWKDLVILADRAARHFGSGEAMVELGRRYYQHLGAYPYARLASSVLTLKGAFFLSHRYTAPANYEALDLQMRWLNRREAITTNRLKYAADPNSEPIMQLTKGIVEYFPTVFGREPLPFLEMEMADRHARYHFKLPPPIRPWIFFKRILSAATPQPQRWQLLREQERQLIQVQWDATRRQRILDDLLSKSAEALVLLEDGALVFLNDAARRLIGNTEHESSLPCHEFITQFGGTGVTGRLKFATPSGDGSQVPLEATLSARLGGGALGRQTLVIRLRDRREPETREEAVSLAREEERQNFAQDLHDGLGQTLSGLTYRIAALRHANPGDTALIAIESGLRSAITTARRLAHGTHEIAAMKPIDRLRLTCASYATLADLRIEFSVVGETAPLTTIDIREMDMILREALANAVKHSGASTIQVSVTLSTTLISLEIRDDGGGLAEDFIPGFGIDSMKNRARTISGSLDLSSGPRGTLVRLTIPLYTAAHQDLWK